MISPPAIMFKGSGWYITDYSDKMKPGGSDAAEKPAAATTETRDTNDQVESTASARPPLQRRPPRPAPRPRQTTPAPGTSAQVPPRRPAS